MRIFTCLKCVEDFSLWRRNNVIIINICICSHFTFFSSSSSFGIKFSNYLKYFFECVGMNECEWMNEWVNYSHNQLDTANFPDSVSTIIKRNKENSLFLCMCSSRRRWEKRENNKSRKEKEKKKKYI